MKLTRTSFTSASTAFSKRGLSAKQKEAMLSRIYSGEEPALSFESPIRSPYQRFIRNPSFVMLVALIVLTSGTVYASNQSLPGDALYGIKVHVVEPISLALQATERDRDTYQTTLIERRANEQVLLRQKLGLGTTTENRATTTTEMHAPTPHSTSPKPTFKKPFFVTKIRGVSVSSEASSTATTTMNETVKTGPLEVHATTTSPGIEASTTTQTDGTTEVHASSLHEMLHLDATVSTPPSVPVSVPTVGGSVLGL